jgi:hypothetical protein
MKKLQMVDLKSQYEKIKDEVNASIQDVLENNTYINGPLVHQFQADLETYLGAKHVIPCANGTDALQIAMMGLDLKPGDEFQLMRRDIDFSYMGKRIDQLFKQVQNRKPFFALYIDCIGRASAFCGTETEEAVEVQKVMIAKKIPLLGVYSGVEVAKVGPKVQALDWTGVLCIWSTEA